MIVKLNLRLLIFMFLYMMSFCIHLYSDNTLDISWQTQGEQEDDYFGHYTAALDFNGDGIDDLVVGAYNHRLDENYQSHRGSMYIYLGSNNGLPDTPDLSVYTPIDTTFIINNNWWNIINLGDMNNDGCEDLGYTKKTNIDQVGVYVSRCMILLGNTDPDMIPDYSFVLDDSSPKMTSLGDINGDGFDDVGIIETLPNSIPHYDDLKYYIIYGGTFEKIPFKIDLITRNGHGFKGLGDVNGDGFDDFSYYFEGDTIVQPDGTILYSHHNRFFFGSSIQDTIPDYSLDLQLPNAWSELAPAGDWNNDGFDDFVLSGYELVAPEEGGCRLWKGGEQINWDSYSYLFYFARFTPAFGDLNGDGKDDLVKIYQYFGLGGYFYLYLGDQNATYDFIWYYDYEGLGFNECVGDFNNDGFADIAAGASGNESYPDYGQVFVWNGHEGLVEQDPGVALAENIVPNPKIEFNAYPNPFNPLVAFEIKTENYSNLQINIFNIKGQKVDVISNNKIIKSQNHQITWNANKQASGVYFCKLINIDNQKQIAVRKITLMK